MKKTSQKERSIAKRAPKKCLVCAKTMSVIFYSDHTYRGGHYFGKIHLYTKNALREAARHGTNEKTLFGKKVNVLKKDPKPYKLVEYWECPTCYWHKKGMCVQCHSV